MDLRKAVELERPQPGPHHDHTNRVMAVHSHGGIRYQYDSDDLQYRYRLLQGKMQVMYSGYCPIKAQVIYIFYLPSSLRSCRALSLS